TRFSAPRLWLNDEPDPLVAAHDAARIQTMEVNLHWFEQEGNAMDLRAVLGNVRCPTLVLVGEHDPLNPRYLAEEIVSAIPNDLRTTPCLSAYAAARSERRARWSRVSTADCVRPSSEAISE